MATVKELLEIKGGSVHSIGSEASVLDAALLMRVVAQRRDPALTKVAQVMTRQVVCCTPDTPEDAVRATFRNRRIRHLPVVDEERRLIGLISIGDLNAHRAQAQEADIHFLRKYIYGRA